MTIIQPKFNLSSFLKKQRKSHTIIQEFAKMHDDTVYQLISWNMTLLFLWSLNSDAYMLTFLIIIIFQGHHCFESVLLSIWQGMDILQSWEHSSWFCAEAILWRRIRIIMIIISSKNKSCIIRFFLSIWLLPTIQLPPPQLQQTTQQQQQRQQLQLQQQQQHKSEKKNRQITESRYKQFELLMKKILN